MSVPVSIERLREAMAGFHAAPYLLTVRDDGRPHAVAVVVSWSGDALVMAAGKTTAANATRRALVSVVWPPDAVGGYSLIVDGEAEVDPVEDSAAVRVRPTRAVLHRAPAPEDGPAASSAGDGCTSDCIPLTQDA